MAIVHASYGLLSVSDALHSWFGDRRDFTSYLVEDRLLLGFGMLFCGLAYTYIRHRKVACPAADA